MKTDDREAGEKLLGVIDLKNEKIVQVIIYSHALAIQDNTFIFNHSETLTLLLSHWLATFAIFPTATTSKFFFGEYELFRCSSSLATSYLDWQQLRMCFYPA